MGSVLRSAFDEEFIFRGTKRRIFDRALELFTEFGFENVSIKDIADAVGIMQSSIYNHFPSKRSILEAMYGYFSEHFADNMLPTEKAKEILQKGTREEFFGCLLFTFTTPDRDKYRRMLLLMKLVYMRLFQDEDARGIFLTVLYEHYASYVKELLDYGVSQGVLQPLDTKTFAEVFVGMRHIIGTKAYSCGDYRTERNKDEPRIMEWLATTLPYTDGR